MRVLAVSLALCVAAFGQRPGPGGGSGGGGASGGGDPCATTNTVQVNVAGAFGCSGKIKEDATNGFLGVKSDSSPPLYSVDFKDTSSKSTGGHNIFQNFDASTWTMSSGADADAFWYNLVLTGAATAGSTWAREYSNLALTLTSGNLTHGLANVNRLTCSSTAGTTIDLCAANYTTTGGSGVNGTVTEWNIAQFGWDAFTGTTGNIPARVGVRISSPPAPTGGLTVATDTGLYIEDASIGGSNCYVTIGVGGPCSGSLKAVANFDSLGTPTYDIYSPLDIQSWLRGGIQTGVVAGWNGAISRNFEAIQNNANTTYAAYNGNTVWDWGIFGGGGGTRWGLVSAGNTANEFLTVLTSGNAGFGVTAPTHRLDVGGDMAITGLPTSAGAGGLNVCIDTAGVLYKKAICP